MSVGNPPQYAGGDGLVQSPTEVAVRMAPGTPSPGGAYRVLPIRNPPPSFWQDETRMAPPWIRLAGILLLLGAPPLSGQGIDAGSPLTPGWTPDLTVGVGYFDPAGLDPGVALDLGWSPRVDRVPGAAVARLGLMVEPSGSVYGHAGLGLPLHLGADSRWSLLPSVAAGLWHRGNGKRLGSRLEFRSGISLRRQLSGGASVGLYLYHLSNAGLGDTNPGVEVLGLSWTRPR